MIKTVFSYGNTGASLGGLLAAERCQIDTQGNAPPYFMTDKGSQPILQERFNLIECESSWAINNIENSAATIILSTDNFAPLTQQVAHTCRAKGIPSITLNPFDYDTSSCLFFLKLLKPTTVNVVGDMESDSNGMTKTTRDYLIEVFTLYQ